LILTIVGQIQLVLCKMYFLSKLFKMQYNNFFGIRDVPVLWKIDHLRTL
jgi:hypothetical protein